MICLNIIILFNFIVAPVIEYEDKYKEPLVQKSGSQLILHVTVTGVPTPKITWTHNDETLTTSNGVTVDTTDTFSTVTVTGVSAKHSGIFTVTAENEVGADKAQFNVTVRGKNCTKYYPCG